MAETWRMIPLRDENGNPISPLTSAKSVFYDANKGTTLYDELENIKLIDVNMGNYNLNGIGDGTITGAINTINSVVRNKKEALSFNSYSEMVGSIYALGSGKLNIGQDLYIGTLGVPDLWIFKTFTSKQAYSFTNDNALIAAIKASGYVQIGYYGISISEGEKVDLSSVNSEIASIKGSVTANANSITLLQQSFQNGCSTIAAAVTAQGVQTAATASPATISSNIITMGNNRYNAGIIAADSRPNTNSTNYQAGYSAGATAATKSSFLKYSPTNSVGTAYNECSNNLTYNVAGFTKLTYRFKASMSFDDEDNVSGVARLEINGVKYEDFDGEGSYWSSAPNRETTGVINVAGKTEISTYVWARCNTNRWCSVTFEIIGVE